MFTFILWKIALMGPKGEKEAAGGLLNIKQCPTLLERNSLKHLLMDILFTSIKTCCPAYELSLYTTLEP